MAYILTEVAEFVGTITLDHERRRNALSQPLVEEVITALPPNATTASRILASSVATSTSSRRFAWETRS